MSKDSIKHREHPEQVPTDNESLHDKFENEQTVDSIPLEDLKKDMKDEKKKHKTKDDSNSEDHFINRK